MNKLQEIDFSHLLKSPNLGANNIQYPNFNYGFVRNYDKHLEQLAQPPQQSNVPNVPNVPDVDLRNMFKSFYDKFIYKPQKIEGFGNLIGQALFKEIQKNPNAGELFGYSGEETLDEFMRNKAFNEWWKINNFNS